MDPLPAVGLWTLSTYLKRSLSRIWHYCTGRPYRGPNSRKSPQGGPKGHRRAGRYECKTSALILHLKLRGKRCLPVPAAASAALSWSRQCRRRPAPTGSLSGCGWHDPPAPTGHSRLSALGRSRRGPSSRPMRDRISCARAIEPGADRPGRSSNGGNRYLYQLAVQLTDWGFPELASQNRWWRRGDSPCDRGLHFARTMTPLACAGWLGGRRALPRGVALALAEIYDGGSRTKAACVGGVGLQTIRDWVLRFNAHGPEGLADRQAPGHPGKLNTAQREALAAMVESGPMPAIHGVVRWRLKDLACGSGRSSGSR